MTVVRRLEHVNILTSNLAQTVSLYSDLLEMKVGPPPSGDPTGAWIYDDEGTPVFHVQSVDPANPELKFAKIRKRLGDLIDRLTLERLRDTGSVEHVALQCVGYQRIKQRCEERGIKLMTSLQANGVRQIFIRDPSGVILELNFPGD